MTSESKVLLFCVTAIGFTAYFVLGRTTVESPVHLTSSVQLNPQIAVSAREPQAHFPRSTQDKEFKNLLRELDELKTCWSTGNCDEDPEDPRASHFRAVQEIKKRLRVLSELENNTSQIALEYLQFPDEGVKTVALRMLESEEPTETNLQVILRSVETSIGDQYFETAVPYLKRYADAGFSENVATAMESFVRSSSLSVAEAAAREARNFITPASYARFRNLQRELPQNSRTRRNLESALLEFEQRQRGG
jgi:hypothetical protein